MHACVNVLKGGIVGNMCSVYLHVHTTHVYCGTPKCGLPEIRTPQ